MTISRLHRAQLYKSNQYYQVIKVESFKHYFLIALIALSSQLFYTKAHEFQLQSRLARPFGNRLKFEVCESPKLSSDIRGGSSDYHGDYNDDPYNDGPFNDDPYYQDGYYEDERDRDNYYDDGRKTPDRRDNSSRDLPKILKNGDKRIGFALLGSGAVFTMLGVSLFFNKSLMRLGNLLFIAGVPMTIGPGRTAGYFFQPKKSRATACLALGIFLVFIGSPVFGILLEIFGLLNLFGNMFPLLKMMIKTLPGVGSLLGDGGRGARRDDSNRDSYEDDQGYVDNYEQGRDDRYYRDRDDGSDRNDWNY